MEVASKSKFIFGKFCNRVSSTFLTGRFLWKILFEIFRESIVDRDCPYYYDLFLYDIIRFEKIGNYLFFGTYFLAIYLNLSDITFFSPLFLNVKTVLICRLHLKSEILHFYPDDITFGGPIPHVLLPFLNDQKRCLS